MKKIITVVLDGFGYRIEEYGNAIQKASMPNFDKLWNNFPHTLLSASEESVGLPVGQIGGSEVGHLTLGAGRVIKQELLAINDLFNQDINSNEEYKKMLDTIISNNSPLHLIGLASDGGVHSHIIHLINLIKELMKTDINKVYLHLIGDGRDTYREKFLNYYQEINEVIKNDSRFVIADICGRYYAMDRDNRWERTKVYYDLLTKAKGFKALDVKKVIESCYVKQAFDEFLPPIVLDESGTIKENDTIFWFNFRKDRARQLLSCFSSKDFDKFPIKLYSNLNIYSFYGIDKSINSKPLLNEEKVNNCLGHYISDLGMTQARIAETEKFAHVTYFFDGLDKSNIDGCDKYLIPSPKVATYDKQPTMSAVDVAKKTVLAMNKDYDFILVNFANPDMVGHTGNIPATISALEEVDRCLGEIIEAAEANFYTIFLLSDHGNCDEMLDEKGNVLTSHSLSKVPFIVNDEKVELIEGSLANVAPAILKYMDIKIPEEMMNTDQILDFK